MIDILVFEEQNMLYLILLVSSITNQNCIDKCNKEYSDKYKACKEVVECRRFVVSEAKECISQCENKP